jgi:hypothetical protein
MYARGGVRGGITFGKTIKLIVEVLAEVTYSVIPEKAGIQDRLKILNSGSRFACPK